MLLILSFYQPAGLLFVSGNRSYLLLGFLNNFCLEERNLSDVKIMLKGEEKLHVISLKLEQLFVLGIIDDEHLVLLPFHLFLEVNIVIGGLHQADSEVTGDDHIHDVHLLDHHSVNLKLLNEVLFQVVGQFGLHVSHFRNSLLFDEISDSFITFFLKKFFKPVRAEVIEELFDVLLLTLRL